MKQINIVKWATCWKNGSIDRKAECDKLFNYQSLDEDGNVRYKVSVVKSSMIGSVYFAAVDVGHGIIKAVVCHTKVYRVSKIKITSFSESDATNIYYNCPKTILKLLTPTTDENALAWRRNCLGGTV